MKKIILLMCAIGLISFSSYAKKSNGNLIENFETNSKSTMLLSQLGLKKLPIPVTLSLSCATVTFNGATGDMMMQYILQGYTSQLVAIFEWFACEGGYTELNPQIPYNYA